VLRGRNEAQGRARCACLPREEADHDVDHEAQEAASVARAHKGLWFGGRFEVVRVVVGRELVERRIVGVVGVDLAVVGRKLVERSGWEYPSLWPRGDRGVACVAA
jgi:hypothetical protein